MSWFPFVAASDVPTGVTAAFGDLEQPIRDASHEIRGVLKTAQFAVNSDGSPADPDVAATIKDATLAQLRFWAETGDQTGAAAQSGGGSILSVTLPGGTATTAADKAEARRAPAVESILRACPGIAWNVSY